jgi:hypothetical protein
VEVESDLSDGRDLGPPREAFESSAVARRIEVLRFVGVDAHGGNGVGARRGERRRSRRVHERGAGDDETPDSRGARTGDDVRELSLLEHLEVAVRIREAERGQIGRGRRHRCQGSGIRGKYRAGFWP